MHTTSSDSTSSGSARVTLNRAFSREASSAESSGWRRASDVSSTMYTPSPRSIAYRKVGSSALRAAAGDGDQSMSVQVPAGIGASRKRARRPYAD
jgi:hypothetical protein